MDARAAAAQLAILLLLPACSEYGFTTIGEPEAVERRGDDPAPPPPADPPAEEPEDPPSDTDDGGDLDEQPPPDDSEPPPLPPCDQTVDAAWEWWGSQPFPGAADPADSDGDPFWSPSFDMVGWSTVAMPDQGHSPPGTDRAYRAAFWLESIPPALMLSMQSDDGLWFWLNGQPVGHWGGSWQEEGCVNDDAACVQTVTVDPVDVTPLLVPGWNAAAARVSNPVMNAFFDVYTDCVEG